MLKTMTNKVIFSLLTIWLCCDIANSGNFRKNVFKLNGLCNIDEFRCFNDACISRRLFCNGVDNCGDKSDEHYCNYGDRCPSKYPFYRCRDTFKCIPENWKCDGKKDCHFGDDEKNCENTEIPNVFLARNKAVRWIFNQAANRTSTNRWGPHVRKTAVALYLANHTFNSTDFTRREMAYEMSIQLLSRMALRRLKDVPTSDLSSYINALLVTCLDPSQFHSLNLVKELRSRVNGQIYSVPYDLLTLCIAGEKITKKDVEKLNETFWSAQRDNWAGTQATVVMALACAGNQQGSSFSLNKIPDFTMELKQKQYRNGNVENLQTTALVMQALFASEAEDDEDNFDEAKALQQILREQREDGSFGNLINTYYVLPVLSYKSLVNISSDRCEPYVKDEETALEDLLNLVGPKKHIRYTLWIGNEKDVERTLKLAVVSNASLYGVMEVARDIDSQYRFQYIMKNGKPYINAISGIQDDPESGKFWFLYILKGTKPSPITISPADLQPKDNDHLVMWYQSGSWIK